MPPFAQLGMLHEPTGQICHVLISHATEHRSGLVEFLRQELVASFPALNVYLDDHTATKAEQALLDAHAAVVDAFVGEIPSSCSSHNSSMPLQLQSLPPLSLPGSCASVIIC